MDELESELAIRFELSEKVVAWLDRVELQSIGQSKSLMLVAKQSLINLSVPTNTHTKYIAGTRVDCG